MSKGESKDWAAIVYGRTYHLDFRLITVPHDFTTQVITWASQHIVATTQQARNLIKAPRWSLFKNDDYCVMGVTCMVKDLIGDTVKDNQGRPLYVFVGYGTQLTADESLGNFPGYSENSLDNFKILYQEIEQVWLIKNYERDSRYPTRSQYYPISFYNEENEAIASDSLEPPLDHKLNYPLNHLSKHPDKIYLWQSSPQQNSLLWQASAQSSVPLTTCLNIQGKAFNNSPFLNQSSSQAESFEIINRGTAKRKSPTQEATNQHQNDIPHRPLAQISQKISNRAKEDIDLTLQQAAKMANASQEVINNLSDWNQSSENEPDKLESLDPAADDPEFGFKTKKSNSCESKQDWF